MVELTDAKLGTVDNPIFRNGKPYAYNKRGKLVMIENFDPNTMDKFTLTRDMKATPDQIRMLREAKQRMQVFDEDCPPSTDEYLEGMRPFWDKKASTLGSGQ